MRDQKISSQMIRLAYQNRIQKQQPTSPAQNSSGAQPLSAQTSQTVPISGMNTINNQGHNNAGQGKLWPNSQPSSTSPMNQGENSAIIDGLMPHNSFSNPNAAGGGPIINAGGSQAVASMAQMTHGAAAANANQSANNVVQGGAGGNGFMTIGLLGQSTMSN